MGGGGHIKFYLYKKNKGGGGGKENVLATLKEDGDKQIWGSFKAGHMKF